MKSSNTAEDWSPVSMGAVLELAAAAGVNFALYPSSVAKVIALEPEPYLRKRATKGPNTASRWDLLRCSTDHGPIDEIDQVSDPHVSLGERPAWP